eukprot:SM000191S05216  [mRNA]  locus=s191:2701:3980:- [translate_table: standard]
MTSAERHAARGASLRNKDRPDRPVYAPSRRRPDAVAPDSVAALASALPSPATAPPAPAENGSGQAASNADEASAAAGLTASPESGSQFGGRARRRSVQGGGGPSRRGGGAVAGRGAAAASLQNAAPRRVLPGSEEARRGGAGGGGGRGRRGGYLGPRGSGVPEHKETSGPVRRLEMGNPRLPVEAPLKEETHRTGVSSIGGTTGELSLPWCTAAATR